MDLTNFTLKIYINAIMQSNLKTKLPPLYFKEKQKITNMSEFRLILVTFICIIYTKTIILFHSKIYFDLKLCSDKYF